MGGQPGFSRSLLATAQFVHPATQGLGESCGPLVFQFPPLGPRFTRAPQQFADALAEFLLALPKLSGAAFYAVEVRDPELLTDDYLAALWRQRRHITSPFMRVCPRFPRRRDSGGRPGGLPAGGALEFAFGLQKYEEAKERYAPFNALVDGTRGT